MVHKAAQESRHEQQHEQRYEQRHEQQLKNGPPRDLITNHPAVRLLIGAVTVLSVGLVVSEHRDNPVVAAMLAVVIISYGVLAAIDVATQRLPNRITGPLAIATALVVIIGGILQADLLAPVSALAIGVGFATLLLVLRFGMGDVKLAITVGMIAGWFGPDAIMATAYVGAASGAVVALILMLVHRRRDVAFGFGPFLALGSVAGMLAGI